MQTTYSINQTAAIVGGLYDLGPNDIVSHQCEANIFFGTAVSKGLTTGGIVAPSASAHVTSVKNLRGVAVRTHAIESVDDVLDPHYSQYDSANIMRAGRVWVKVEDTVTEASDVYVRYAGTGTKGAFRSNDPGSEAAKFPGNAKWLSAADAGGLALLEFDIR